MESDASSKGPVPDLPTFLVATIVAVFFAYLGACSAGSDPSGWGVGALFVLPLIFFEALFAAAISIFAALPFPRSSPTHFLVLAGINSIGAALAAFATIKLIDS